MYLMDTLGGQKRGGEGGVAGCNCMLPCFENLHPFPKALQSEFMTNATTQTVFRAQEK